METRLRILLTSIIIFLCFGLAQAALPDGSDAPDWTVTDINGVEHSLQEHLDAGRQVYLVFSATWCGPCWSYHNSGHMESIWEDFGPNGTDEARVFFFEADLSTNEDCLYGPSGCNGTTQGNWVDGIPFPIINCTSGNGGTLPSDYNITYFPTVYTVCPNGKIYETGQASAQVLETYMTSCEISLSSIDPYDELCYEDETGGVNLDYIPGYGNTSFDWSNGSSQQNLSDVGQGTYQVTVSDANGVFFEAEASVGGPAAPLSIEEDALDVNLDCYGDADAYIQLSGAGGTPTYDAIWDDGTQGFTRTDLAVGSYAVSLTDANGCEENTSYTVVEPPELTMGLTTIDENCDQSDGVIIVTASGGTPNLKYDIGNGPTSNNSFIDLPAGNYSVTVSDANDCSTFEDTELENIPAPVAAAPDSLELGCSGTLEIDATESEVSSETDILWTTSDGEIEEGEESLTLTVSAAGTYTLTLSNGTSGCEDETEVIVEASPNQPEANAGPNQEINCEGEVVTLGSSESSSGPEFAYVWTNQNGDTLGQEQFLDVSTAGSFTLEVINTNLSCSESSTAVVEVLNSLVATVEVEGPITCDQPEVLLSADGSTEGDDIAHLWYDEMDQQVGEGLEIFVSNPGEYTLIVLDTVSLCEEVTSSQVESEIDAPDVSIEGELTIGCDLEPVALVASTSSDVILSWVGIIDGDTLQFGAQDTLLAEEPGIYFLTAMNEENGCSSTANAEVELDGDLPQMEIESPDLITCIREEITLDATGSSQGPNFETNWSTVDGNIIEGANTLSPIVNSIGTYELTILNTVTNCENTMEVEVDGYSSAPELMVDHTTEHLSFSGTATVNGYFDEVHWDFGDGNVATGLEVSHQYASSGEYEVVVTTDNECGPNEQSLNVEVNAEAMSASGSIVHVDCFGDSTGAIDLSVSGGIAPYEYHWSNGSEDEDLIGVSAGNYTVTITDGEGTEEELSLEVEEPELIETENVEIQDANVGSANGAVLVELSGGITPYSYEWSTGDTTQNLEGVESGLYELTVIDANGCSQSFGPFEVQVISSVDRGQHEDISLRIFPNPVESHFYISAKFGKVVNLEVSMLSANGSLIGVRSFSAVETIQEKWDVGNLPSGLYLLRLATPDETWIEMIVK